MSRRPVRAPPGRGSGKTVAAPGPDVDPRLMAVADWLRNEKRSGLTTKEAVQYEKVRARAGPAVSGPAQAVPVAAAAAWRVG